LICHKGISARSWPIKIGLDDVAAYQVTTCNQGYCTQYPPDGFFAKNLKRIENNKNIQGNMKNGFPQKKKKIIQKRVNKFAVQQKH
jgi:hypothetical protein